MHTQGKRERQRESSLYLYIQVHPYQQSFLHIGHISYLQHSPDMYIDLLPCCTWKTLNQRHGSHMADSPGHLMHYKHPTPPTKWNANYYMELLVRNHEGSTFKAEFSLFLKDTLVLSNCHPAKTLATSSHSS